MKDYKALYEKQKELIEHYQNQPANNITDKTEWAFKRMDIESELTAIDSDEPKHPLSYRDFTMTEKIDSEGEKPYYCIESTLNNQPVWWTGLAPHLSQEDSDSQKGMWVTDIHKAKKYRQPIDASNDNREFQINGMITEHLDISQPSPVESSAEEILKKNMIHLTNVDLPNWFEEYYNAVLKSMHEYKSQRVERGDG